MTCKPQTLKVLQYNTQKSREVMSVLLPRNAIGDYDILEIQGPYRNTFQNISHHPVKDRFHPPHFDSRDARILNNVGKKIVQGTWKSATSGVTFVFSTSMYQTAGICASTMFTADQVENPTYNH
ncbi:hypothetical protein AYL99_11797 [Fonsecaea erecta]|uniref:Endonuclease/exonuclease/phosphatase domain-containing protein n=1 Tax=Fonsecaea erecta TaxID=1367422 RepID=A0A178Z2U1_9EURO|nr:hypothetical protein AYL99_11797 [Fonsecaea erecta]OAP54037.1 hypothetical protein AYL99_11797 [Fonsecaea erecta]